MLVLSDRGGGAKEDGGDDAMKTKRKTPTDTERLNWLTRRACVVQSSHRYGAIVVYLPAPKSGHSLRKVADAGIAEEKKRDD